MFHRLEIACLYWPSTESSSMALKVQTLSYEVEPPLTQVFHERKMELLPGGGTPGMVFMPHVKHAVLRWQKLVDMSAPPF